MSSLSAEAAEKSASFPAFSLKFLRLKLITNAAFHFPCSLVRCYVIVAVSILVIVIVVVVAHSCWLKKIFSSRRWTAISFEINLIFSAFSLV